MLGVRFRSRAPGFGRGTWVPRSTRPGRAPASNECKDPRSSEGAVRPRSGRMNSRLAQYNRNQIHPFLQRFVAKVTNEVRSCNCSGQPRMNANAREWNVWNCLATGERGSDSRLLALIGGYPSEKLRGISSRLGSQPTTAIRCRSSSSTSSGRATVCATSARRSSRKRWRSLCTATFTVPSVRFRGLAISA